MSSPIIKQICYNPDNSRLILYSSDGTHYLCDIYGNRKLEFLPGISGTVTTKERKKLAPLSINVNYSSIPKMKFYAEYFPITRKFEGYSFFPRPIASPFVNIPSFDLNNLCKRELVNQLQKYFSSDDAKIFIENKGENKGLSFFTCDLNQFDSAKEDSKKLINIIDKTIEDYKEENKFKLNVSNKNPFVSSLLKFKKVLEMNGSMKIINGKLMKEPNNDIKNQYKFIYNKIDKFGLKKIKNYRYAKTEGTYDSKYDFMDINSITKSSDITLGKRINEKFGIFSYEEDKKMKEEMEKKRIEDEKLKKEEEERKKKEEEEKLKKEEEERKKKEEEEKKKKEEEEKNKKEEEKNKKEEEKKEDEEIKKEEEKIEENNNLKNMKNESKITIEKNYEEEKKKEEEEKKKKEEEEKKKNQTQLSFISYMSENEKKYENENIISVKSEKQLEVNLNKEKRFLPGYKKEIIKEKGLVQKSLDVQLKSNGELFFENLELLKKTNPIAYENQKKKDEYDFKQLKRQREQNRINAKNATRNYELQKKKEKEEKEKKENENKKELEKSN